MKIKKIMERQKYAFNNWLINLEQDRSLLNQNKFKKKVKSVWVNFFRKKMMLVRQDWRS
jgi:hypothetical protein